MLHQIQNRSSERFFIANVTIYRRLLLQHGINALPEGNPMAPGWRGCSLVVLFMGGELPLKLREYRKSLISEAVTGKFKVPGV